MAFSPDPCISLAERMLHFRGVGRLLHRLNCLHLLRVRLDAGSVPDVAKEHDLALGKVTLGNTDSC